MQCQCKCGTRRANDFLLLQSLKLAFLMNHPLSHGKTAYSHDSRASFFGFVQYLRMRNPGHGIPCPPGACEQRPHNTYPSVRSSFFWPFHHQPISEFFCIMICWLRVLHLPLQCQKKGSGQLPAPLYVQPSLFQPSKAPDATRLSAPRFPQVSAGCSSSKAS